MTENASPPGYAARERSIISAFVDLSNELVDGYDTVELLSRLTTHCALLLDVGAAGLLLKDRKGALHLAATTSERTRDLGLFQLQREEGPCLDCYRSGAAVIVPDLAAERERWPHFCQAAVEAGFASVHALPIRLEDTILGSLGLFGNDAGRLPDDDLALAQALAHVASLAIVSDATATDVNILNTQLQHALNSRVVIEQAKGVIAYAGGLEMEDAFEALRRYARDHATKLSTVATRIVNRELSSESVLQHVEDAAPTPEPQ